MREQRPLLGDSALGHPPARGGRPGEVPYAAREEEGRAPWNPERQRGGFVHHACSCLRAQSPNKLRDMVNRAPERGHVPCASESPGPAWEDELGAGPRQEEASEAVPRLGPAERRRGLEAGGPGQTPWGKDLGPELRQLTIPSGRDSGGRRAEKPAVTAGAGRDKGQVGSAASLCSLDPGPRRLLATVAVSGVVRTRVTAEPGRGERKSPCC